MYENDEFRQKAHGHICGRDRLMFLWEALVDENEMIENLDESSELSDLTES